MRKGRGEGKDAETGMGRGLKEETRNDSRLTLHIPRRDPHIGALGRHVALV